MYFRGVPAFFNEKNGIHILTKVHQGRIIPNVRKLIIRKLKEGRMDLSFHYLLMAVQAMVHKELLSGLNDTPLSTGQPKVLDYLREHDGSNQRDIANGCHIEPPTLTSILKRMEKGGLIERRIQDNNRRTLYVYLTSEGKKYQRRVEEEFQKIEKELFEGLSTEEIHKLMDGFQHVYENLKKKRGID